MEFFVAATEAEISSRKSNYQRVDAVVNLKQAQQCTSCQANISKDVVTGQAHYHPLLDTLVCAKCQRFYGDPAEFSTEEDGSDKYCRWCGQGGSLYSCTSCPRAFCKKCIKRNVSRTHQAEAEKDDWECFCCDSKPIWELRSAAWLAKEYSKLIRKKKKGREASPDNDYRPSNERVPKKQKGRSESIPTLKHVTSAVRIFSGHMDKCARLWDKFQEDVEDMKVKMRRYVTDPETAENVTKDLYGFTQKLATKLTAAGQDLQQEMDDWVSVWDKKVEEEKEMEAKGEIVDGRLVLKSKPKKGNKKLAATAGGGDSSEEVPADNNSEDEAKNSDEDGERITNRSPKKRYLAKKDTKKNKSSKQETHEIEDEDDDDEDEREEEEEVIVNGDSKRSQRTPKRKSTLNLSKRSNDDSEDSESESDTKMKSKRTPKSLKKRKH